MREQEARPSLGARVPCPAPAASALRPPAEEGWRKRYLRTELLPKEGQGHLVRMQHSSGLDPLWKEQPHLRRLARSLPSQAPAQVNGLETLTGSGPRRVRVPRGRGRSRVAVSGLSPKRPEEEPPRPAREERGAAGAPRPRAVGRGPRRGARPRLRASPGRGRRGPRRRGARGEAPGLPRSPCARRRGPGPAQRGSPPRVRSVRSAAGRQAAERGRAGAPCPGVPRRRRDSRGSAGKGRMSPHFLPVNKNVTFQTVPWLGPLNPEPLGFVVVVL